MSINRLYATVAGTSPPTYASIDIRADGDIVAVAVDARVFDSAMAPADGSYAFVQVSFASQVSEGANDDRASIAVLQIGLYDAGAAAGTLRGDDRIVIAGLKIPVKQGERIWLHVVNSASTITTSANAHLYIAASRPTSPRTGARAGKSSSTKAGASTPANPMPATPRAARRPRPMPQRCRSTRPSCSRSQTTYGCWSTGCTW